MTADGGPVVIGTANGVGYTTLELRSATSAGMLSGFGTSITNFDSLVFDSKADWTVAGNTSPSGLGTLAIGGFAVGDTIDVTGFHAIGKTFANDTLVLTGDGDIQTTLHIQGSFSSSLFSITSDGDGSANVTLQSGQPDITPPVATITVANNTLAIGEMSLVTFTFSEPVIGFDNTDLTIANGTLSPVSSDDGGITWTATLTPNGGITSATNVITLNNAGLREAADNTGSGSTPSNNNAIDTMRPIATILIADPSLTFGEMSLVTFTFSEPVTGLTNADLTVAHGTLSAPATFDGGVTWTAMLTPSTDFTGGTNAISLDNTGVADLAGNAGVGSTLSNNYAIDTSGPTLAITSSATRLTTGETATITFTFSEDPERQLRLGRHVRRRRRPQQRNLERNHRLRPDPHRHLHPSHRQRPATASITVAAGLYTDAAGNLGGPGATPAISIDTLAPSVPVIASVGGTDQVVSLQTGDQTVLGTAEAGSTVTLTFGTATLGAVIANGGTWSYTLTPDNLAAIGEGSGKTYRHGDRCRGQRVRSGHFGAVRGRSHGAGRTGRHLAATRPMPSPRSSPGPRRPAAPSRSPSPAPPTSPLPPAVPGQSISEPPGP